MTNIQIKNSIFNEALVTNTGIVTNADFNRGWIRASNSVWSRNQVTEQAIVTDKLNASSGLIQVIKDDRISRGLQSLSFNILHNGINNNFKVQIFGVNGEFKCSNWNMSVPTPLVTTSPIETVTLFESTNYASVSSSDTLINEDIDFSIGYEYIVIRLYSLPIKVGESLSIDNFYIKDANKFKGLIGANLNGIAYWSPEKPFIDLSKFGSTWLPQKQGVWDTKESISSILDSEGYPTTLYLSDTQQFTFLSILISKANEVEYLAGDYVVLYDGEGTINYSLDAKLKSRLPGRDLINVTPSDAGILLSIMATGPINYINNIRVVSVAFEENYSTAIFNPDFKEHINSFRILRYMDWMGTNGSNQKEWINRPGVKDYTYSRKGVPLEVMVSLANTQKSSPWFCIPHLATDEYITNFATYVKENLDPDLDIYVEYTNEAWNWQFKQTSWIDQQAKAEDMGSNFDWYSRRTVQITQIWDSVFGTDKDRVIGVMGAQAGNTATITRALDYKWTTTPLSHIEYGIDAIAIAPYFGHYIGADINENDILSWIGEPDGGLDKLFQEIRQGGLLSNSPAGGALKLAYDRTSRYINIARAENLKLIAYEGGQHLVDKSKNAQIENLFKKANRDIRMGEIYEEYLSKWLELGGGEFLLFSDVSSYTKFGYWGLSEKLNELSPKYSAVLSLLS